MMVQYAQSPVSSVYAAMNRDDLIATCEQQRQELASCHRQITAYKLREDRRKEIWRNKDLGPMEKAVFQRVIERVEELRVDITSPVTLSREGIASEIGCAPDTVTNKYNALRSMEVLDYEVGETVFLPDGSAYTPTTVTCRELAKTPALIVKDPNKKQGGSRQKGCKRCGNTFVDKYTVHYCPECQQAGWYGQVGLRKDANVLDAMRAACRSDVLFDAETIPTPPQPDNLSRFPIVQDAFGKNGQDDTVFPIVQDAFEKKPQDDMPENETIALPQLVVLQDDNPLYDKLQEEEPGIIGEEDNPITPPLPSTVAQLPTPPDQEEKLPTDEWLKQWLQRYLGVDEHGNAIIIVATGRLETARKYYTKEFGYLPDLDAYLAGHREHIYGSCLRQGDGKTWKICFEIDQAELDAMKHTFLLDLSLVGAFAVYWQRLRNRGHLEIYFDRPVNPEQARQWCIAACPDLAKVPECFPCRDREHNRLSWPFWQRVGKRVFPSMALAVSRDWHNGRMIEASIQDPEALADLLDQAVTPADLVESFPFEEEKEEPKPQQPARSRAASAGGGYMEKEISDQDLAKEIIRDFNNSHEWEDKDILGKPVHGKYRAVWRGEDTPSVAIDRNGQYACDHGRTGTAYRKKLDKYEVWCLVNGVDKKADLKERCQKERERRAELKKTALAVPSSEKEEEEKRKPQSPEKKPQHACKRCHRVDGWVWHPDHFVADVDTGRKEGLWLCDCIDWWYEHPEQRGYNQPSLLTVTSKGEK